MWPGRSLAPISAIDCGRSRCVRLRVLMRATLTQNSDRRACNGPECVIRSHRVNDVERDCRQKLSPLILNSGAQYNSMGIKAKLSGFKVRTWLVAGFGLMAAILVGTVAVSL